MTDKGKKSLKLGAVFPSHTTKAFYKFQYSLPSNWLVINKITMLATIF